MSRVPVQPTLRSLVAMSVLLGGAAIGAGVDYIAFAQQLGIEIGHVLEGSVTLEHAGEPARTLEAGDAFKDEPGMHNAKNTGSAPVRILAVYLVEDGKPLVEPAA
jgi:uncharacterized cupin superfamily protein